MFSVTFLEVLTLATSSNSILDCSSGSISFMGQNNAVTFYLELIEYY